MTDACCQLPAGHGTVSLAEQYPANLLYAQGMLNTSMLQLQQVELQIAMLRGYLNKHMSLDHASEEATKICKDGTTTRLIFSGDAEALAAAAAALRAYSDSVQQATGARAGAAAPNAQAEPAAADAAQQPAQVEQQRAVHRRRLAAAVKVALVMILLEFKMGWFFIYFFAVFFYIGGMFDSWIDWFQNFNNNQNTLEHQLNALRRGQANAGEAAAGAAARAGNADAAAPAADAAPAAARADGDSAGTGEGEAAQNAAEGEVQATPAAPAPPQPPLPPYWQRFIYQLIVMFFGTLIPWWNPNPRYLG
eukprot:gb/GFBE01051482.1/.p1 GENE.gb/GFBE01051482.1/~~gb/GFBE01051482.1/.p1  ORF type:complete len:306 (+),score=84.57 gb/GFBE01051482.1/:1-918(+)